MTKALVALARTAASVMVRAVLPAATARIASVVDVKQVGRELGVRYVLEGNVRKQAPKAELA
jgi:TolB-like protein